MRSKLATVRSFCTLPVFSVEAGSNSRTCASSSATGRCSTPRGTIRNSPSSSQTCRSRNSLRNRPLTTRKSSSSWSWWCQTNGPWNLTSFTSWPFSSPTIFGFHWSLNCASFSPRFTFSTTALPSLSFVSVHDLPGRPQEVELPVGRLLQANRSGHRQVERERHGRLPLGHEQLAREPAPAEPLVERDQPWLADQQAEIDIPPFVEEVQRPPDRRAGVP